MTALMLFLKRYKLIEIESTFSITLLHAIASLFVLQSISEDDSTIDTSRIAKFLNAKSNHYELSDDDVSEGGLFSMNTCCSFLFPSFGFF